jgi:pimeloyl-ACP methyl ester carboxylesterase
MVSLTDLLIHTLENEGDTMPKATVNGIKLYYQVHGHGDPLVLIQGFGGGHEGWFFQARVFKKVFKVIIFDNRGIARTDRSPEPYTIETMADDTIGLMDHLGIEKAHILGMSLGGVVAQEMAIKYPARVKKLILVCTLAEQAGIPEAIPEFSKALGDRRSADVYELMDTIVSLAFNKRRYRMITVPMWRRQVKRLGVDGYLDQMEALSGHSTLDRLHLIEAPTLVMTGTEDRIVPPRSSDEIAERIPNAELLKVDGGSHAFFLEKRRRFNREILDFLVDGRSGSAEPQDKGG